jgi:glucosamine-phosphate N-acetyltransferase
MKINLIISTYSGLYSTENKENYLKKNLLLINNLKTDIEQITIMKPKVDSNHIEIKDYYNFENLNLNNIKNKIVIYDCDNIGISYGQFFTGIFKDLSFDYYIFIEDDYVPFINYFEKEFINEYLKNNDNSLLCSFIYKNKFWDIISYANIINEEINNISILNEKLDKYNINNLNCNIPDFSLCVLSNNAVKKIINKFNSLDCILDIFNIKLTKIWIHQIIFGYIINSSGIKIYDITESYMNIFYNTSNDSISLCNFENYISNWKDKIYNNEKFKLPIFLPIQLFNTNKYDNDIKLLQQYLLEDNKYYKYYNFLNNIFQKNINNNYMNQLIIREIEYNDYNNGYLDLMFEFTNYEYKVTERQFKYYLDQMKYNKLSKILVIYSNIENKIIGAGTIFKLNKMHNNPIGQIEDVIISEKYRGYGLGKLIIEKLIKIGLDEFKCYKIILNCLDKNIDFYKKCNFEIAGVEMKYIK